MGLPGVTSNPGSCISDARDTVALWTGRAKDDKKQGQARIRLPLMLSESQSTYNLEVKLRVHVVFLLVVNLETATGAVGDDQVVVRINGDANRSV